VAGRCQGAHSLKSLCRANMSLPCPSPVSRCNICCVCLIVPGYSQVLEMFGEEDRAFDCSEVAHCGASVAEGEVDAVVAVYCQRLRSESLLESFLRSVCVLWPSFILLSHFIFFSSRDLCPVLSAAPTSQSRSVPGDLSW
jgi:hypothetical protein